MSTAAALAAIGFGTWVNLLVDPPTCYGIGWGCTPDALTTVLFVALLIVPFYLAAAGVLLVIGGLVAVVAPRAGRLVLWAPTALTSVIILLLMVSVPLDLISTGD